MPWKRKEGYVRSDARTLACRVFAEWPACHCALVVSCGRGFVSRETACCASRSSLEGVRVKMVITTTAVTTAVSSVGLALHLLSADLRLHGRDHGHACMTHGHEAARTARGGQARPKLKTAKAAAAALALPALDRFSLLTLGSLCAMLSPPTRNPFIKRSWACMQTETSSTPRGRLSLTSPREYVHYFGRWNVGSGCMAATPHPLLTFHSTTSAG
jgi:hypothetical protein